MARADICADSAGCIRVARRQRIGANRAARAPSHGDCRRSGIQKDLPLAHAARSARAMPPGRLPPNPMSLAANDLSNRVAQPENRQAHAAELIDDAFNHDAGTMLASMGLPALRVNLYRHGSRRLASASRAKLRHGQDKLWVKPAGTITAATTSPRLYGPRAAAGIGHQSRGEELLQGHVKAIAAAPASAH